MSLFTIFVYVLLTNNNLLFIHGAPLPQSSQGQPLSIRPADQFTPEKSSTTVSSSGFLDSKFSVSNSSDGKTNSRTTVTHRNLTDPNDKGTSKTYVNETDPLDKDTAQTYGNDMLISRPDGQGIDVTNGPGPDSKSLRVEGRPYGPEYRSKKTPYPYSTGNSEADAHFLLMKIKMLTAKIMRLVGMSPDQSSDGEMGGDDVSDYGPPSSKKFGVEPGFQSFHITGGPKEVAGKRRTQGDDMSRFLEASPIPITSADSIQPDPSNFTSSIPGSDSSASS